DLALVGIGDLALPGDLAGVLVGRDQSAVERVRNTEVAPKGHTAVVDTAASHRTRPVMVSLGIHLPEQRAFAAVGVDLVDRAPSIGDIHHAVLDDRGTFETAMRPDPAAFDAAELHRPCDLEIFHIVFVDLIEGGKAGGGK